VTDDAAIIELAAQAIRAWSVSRRRNVVRFRSSECRSTHPPPDGAA
jgi:hypothetical protein